MTSLRSRFQRKEIVVAPGCYDALSALMIEQAGFPAAYFSGASLAYTRFGRPDIGLVAADEVVDAVAAVRERVELPLIVDCDTGFGNALNVMRTVKTMARAGAAAIQLEDQTSPKRCGHLADKSLIGAREMVGKLKAALDARRDPDFFIAARTDAAGVDGLNAAIERARLFMEAGADMAKPMGVDTIEDIKRVLREVGGPHMATLSQAAGLKKRSLEELEAAGVVAATFPSIALFAAANAVRNVLRILKAENSLTATFDHLLPLDDYYELVGLKAMLTREESYDKAAEALTHKRAAE